MYLASRCENCPATFTPAGGMNPRGAAHSVLFRQCKQVALTLFTLGEDNPNFLSMLPEKAIINCIVTCGVHSGRWSYSALLPSPFSLSFKLNMLEI